MNDTTNTDTTSEQPEDLTAQVQKYFSSTNPSDLQEALVAMADRIGELEATVAGLREALGH